MSASLQGSHLLEADFMMTVLPEHAALGISEQQRRNHVAILRLLQRIVRQHNLGWLALDDALITALTIGHRESGWEWSTLDGYYGILLGAWRRLNQYTIRPTPLTTWHLTSSRTFLDAHRYVTRKKRESAVKFPVCVTIAEVRKMLAVMRETKAALHALCVIAWWSCARIGDAVQMHRDEVVLQEDGNVTFHLRRGKGVTASTPYTIHSFIVPTSPTFIAFQAFLRRAAPGPLFAAETKIEQDRWGIQLRDTARAINPALCQRSFRRGALQHLAMQSTVSEKVMLDFSGHTTVKMLRRYLNWGAVNEMVAQEARAAAVHLNPEEEMPLTDDELEQDSADLV
ncbi:MAG: hypothetical protein JKY54_19020 [Flavobacteriales bacterium]|nr:hypothetical protein [Flavobacteriales bacterium]